MHNKLVKIIVIIAVLLLVAILFSCCTKQKMTRSYGGTTTINVKKGYKIVEATWKDSNLWYLIEPMDSDYVPKTKEFIESSRFGVMEGKVIFIEEK